jgi:hypothetical protein
VSALDEGLAAFDEAALATLANIGLVRRAARDVAEGKARLVERKAVSAVVEADGQRVEIDAGGPQKARCSCKAPGVCRHRIAAVLLLRQTEGTEQADTPEPSALDPVALLDILSLSAIERWAGKAAWRAALEMSEAPAGIDIEDKAIVVRIDEAEPVRILQGQGLDGIVSKAPAGRRKPLHAAALLAARRYFAMALPEPSVEVAVVGPDDAIEPVFLAAVASALEECVGFAFTLAPAPLEQRLFTLSVSSRADALPRLGRLLRTLAAQLRLKRRRAFTFDPDLCLETLATAYALVRALGRPDPDETLRGISRQAYPPSGPLRLFGCGAERWRTEAGARGVTGIFYDGAADRWLTYAHARAPGQDPLFDAGQAYRGAAIWNGATLDTLAGSVFTLEGAGVSPDGRLSNPQGARASRIEAPVDPVASDALAVDDWQALTERFRARFGFGLAARTAPDFALLSPRRCAAPYFDDLAQELIWPVEDAGGRWLALALPHGDTLDHAIGHVEAVARWGWRGHLLVRANRTARGIDLTPISLFEAGRWVSLTLIHATMPKVEPGWLERLTNRLSSRQGADFHRVSPDPTRHALASAWQAMIDHAESLSGHRPSRTVQAISQLAGELDRLGRPTLGQYLRHATDGRADHFLAAAYALMAGRSQTVALPRLSRAR